MLVIYNSFSCCARIYFTALCILSTFAVAAQVRLVADLQPGDPNSTVIEKRKSFSMHTVSAGRAFFVVDGKELWTSNGTSEGTVLVREFSEIPEMKAINGIAYFTAFTQEKGYELWKSDGSRSGTNLLLDLYAGPGSGRPMKLTVIGSLLYFSANNQTHGRELWKSDGTVAGTVMIKDIRAGAASSDPRNMVASNGKVFFSANDGTTGYELYTTDGTTAGTSIVEDIFPGVDNSSAPGELADVNGVVFFTATVPPTGRQLWKSDGTSSGTKLVKVIRTDSPNAHIQRIVNLNGTAFFSATNGTGGNTLWKSDGTEAGTEMFIESLDPLRFSNALGMLFFQSSSFIWRTDGTVAGTRAIGYGGMIKMSLAEMNGFVLLSGSEFYAPILVRSDGSSWERLAGEEAMRAERSFDPMFQVMNGKCYYFANESYWETDGTPEGLKQIRSLGYSPGLSPTLLADANGTLYFTSRTRANGLWKSDGSDAGTQSLNFSRQVLLMEGYQEKMYVVTPDASSWYTFWVADENGFSHVPMNFQMNPLELEGMNGSIFLTCNPDWPGGNENYGELWSWNGSRSLQLKVFSGPPRTIGPPPGSLTAIGSRLFFTAFTFEDGVELWMSDGTRAGTVLVKDISPGTASTNFRHFISHNGKLFFQIQTSSDNVELWTSDGTTGGTAKIADIPGDPSQQEGVGKLFGTSSFLFYSSRNAAGMSSLWRSSGTTAGTIKLLDFPEAQFVSVLGVFGTRAIFAVQTSTYVEIWKSDGTPAGTDKIRRLNNETVSFASNGASNGQALYFTTTFRPSGEVSIWRTNANYSGTYMIPFDGELPYPNLTASGPYIYFTGLTPEYGTELYLIDERISSASITTVERPAIEIVNYPNPFASHFILRVNGEAAESFSVDIVSKGRTVSKTLLPCNVDHALGQSWEPGLYVMTILHKNKTTVRKMIKI